MEQTQFDSKLSVNSITNFFYVSIRISFLLSKKNRLQIGNGNFV